MTNEVLTALKDAFPKSWDSLEIEKKKIHRKTIERARITISSKGADDALQKLRDTLPAEKYFAYLNPHFTSEGCLVCVLDTPDQFDALEFEETQEDPDLECRTISTAEIIDQLMDWDARFGIDIFSADSEGLSLRLKALPKGLEAFAQEAIGWGSQRPVGGHRLSEENLALELKKTKTLHLAWQS